MRVQIFPVGHRGSLIKSSHAIAQCVFIPRFGNGQSLGLSPQYICLFHSSNMQICACVCVKLAELRPASETCDMFRFFFCSQSSVEFTFQGTFLLVATCVATCWQSSRISCISTVDYSGVREESCHLKQPKWSQRASGMACGLEANDPPGKWAWSSPPRLYWVCQISPTPGWHGWVRELAHNKGDVPHLLPVSVASLNQEWRKVGIAC